MTPLVQERTMGKVNWGRVFLCGLLAGFTANLLQFTVNRLFLFRAWETALKLGLPMSSRNENRLPLAIMTFLGGIFAVGIYAMIRPRYGARLKTAALAGLVFWLVGWLFPVALWNLSGPLSALPPRLLAIHLATYLVTTVLATTVGAWPYQEWGAHQQH
jgi:hypothetical protein